MSLNKDRLSVVTGVKPTEYLIEESKYKDIVNEIKHTGENDIEDLAIKLNQIIILGVNTWELILYSVLSPFAPKLKINGIKQRGNIHFLFIGDISTAKSSASRIIMSIAPNSTRLSKSTEASFEGVYDSHRDEIKEGLLDLANHGMLVIPEFAKMFERFKILREVLDGDTIPIYKGGQKKELTPNITFFASCNPKNDFFRNKINLRQQITFQDGLLSRIDCVVPLLATKKKNEMLLNKLSLFQDNQIDMSLDEIQERLRALSTGMNKIRSVDITKEQESMLKEAFIQHNENLSWRPLILLRDLEILARLVNTITASNFPNRTIEDEIIEAKDSDIIKGIELWEEIINHRKTLYTTEKREVYSIKEHILKEVLKRGNKVRQVELKKIITDRGYCCERTVENKINQLLEEGRINRKGMRNGLISVL